MSDRGKVLLAGEGTEASKDDLREKMERNGERENEM